MTYVVNKSLWDLHCHAKEAIYMLRSHLWYK